MFKTLMIAYMGIYILVVLAAAVYSYFKSKHMNLLCFILSLISLAVILLSLVFYAQSYHPIQMLAFALSFTLISSLFLYNGVQDKNSKFSMVMTLSVIRLFIHLQLLFLLYLFR